MKRTEICAVIPAAGRGSRLGLDGPKILAPLGGDTVVWTILRDTLAPCTDHIHVVISPVFREVFEAVALGGPHRDRVSVGVQAVPRGMGDAVWSAREVWQDFEYVLIVWGDQAGISSETVSRTIRLHRSGQGPRCTLPVVELERPYVQYVLNHGRLEQIRQTREGAAVDERGYSDVGIFMLNVAGLSEAWNEYSMFASLGNATGEVNFLPFLVYLSQQRGWNFHTLPVSDSAEARGINTAQDLQFFKQRLGPRHPDCDSPFSS